MVGVVIAAHGRQADTLLAVAEGIAGKLERVTAVNLLPGEGLEQGKQKLREAIARVDGDAGVVVLVDLFGGTPSTCALGLLDDGKVEVVAGFNLPMLLKLSARTDGEDAASVAAALVEYGQKNIVHASALLRGRGADGGQGR